jgi:hypothetical protein
MNERILLEVWTGALGVPVARRKLDVGQLSSGKQSEFRQLLHASGILDLPETSHPPEKIRDGTELKIVVEQEGQTRTVRIADERVTPSARQFIDFINANGS